MAQCCEMPRQLLHLPDIVRRLHLLDGLDLFRVGLDPMLGDQVPQ